MRNGGLVSVADVAGELDPVPVVQAGSHDAWFAAQSGQGLPCGAGIVEG
jgi:hypothetical protein